MQYPFQGQDLRMPVQYLSWAPLFTPNSWYCPQQASHAGPQPLLQARTFSSDVNVGQHRATYSQLPEVPPADQNAQLVVPGVAPPQYVPSAYPNLKPTISSLNAPQIDGLILPKACPEKSVDLSEDRPATQVNPGKHSQVFNSLYCTIAPSGLNNSII